MCRTVPNADYTKVKIEEDLAYKRDNHNLFLTHLKALLIKRFDVENVDIIYYRVFSFNSTRRDRRAFCYQLLVPVIFLLIILGLLKFVPPIFAVWFSVVFRFVCSFCTVQEVEFNASYYNPGKLLNPVPFNAFDGTSGGFEYFQNSLFLQSFNGIEKGGKIAYIYL